MLHSFCGRSYHPKKLGQKVLMYISGDGAEEFKVVMSKYGMNIEIVPGEVGKATMLKTLGSMFYKGVQALFWELAHSARKIEADLNALELLIVYPVSFLPREKEMAFWIVRGGLHAGR